MRGPDESERWLEQAKEDMRWAGVLLEQGGYHLVAFLSLQVAEKGLKAGGVSPDGKLVEMVELADHPWFVGCQFHPEFKSRPMDPHPLFVSYIKACVDFSRVKAETSAEIPEKIRKIRLEGPSASESNGAVAE